jgi:hypothetical protein
MNNSMGIAKASFRAAKAAGPTGPTFDGCDDQHTQGDAPGDTNTCLGDRAD